MYNKLVHRKDKEFCLVELEVTLDTLNQTALRYDTHIPGLWKLYSTATNLK